MAELLYRLGKASAQRAWIVIVAWVAVLGLAGGAFALGAGTLATSFDVPGTASGEVTDELAQKLPDYSGASGQIVLHTEDGEPFSDEQRAEVADLAAGIRDLPDVARVVDPFEAEQERADRQQEITDGRAQLEQGRAQLESGQAQLDAARAEVESGQAQLQDAQEQLDAARAQAEAGGAPASQLAALDQVDEVANLVRVEDVVA